MGEGFDGRRVVSLESRRAGEMATLIRTFGGDPLVAPSLREIPLEDNPEAFAFADRLLAGELDAVVFLTGVGTKTLFQALEGRYSQDELVDALARVTVIVRGPKPGKVLRDMGIPIGITVPEPNTWRELLEALEAEPHGIDLKGARIAIQEYGITNQNLVTHLENRGAEVMRVPVYRWALPDDLEPMKTAVRELAEGRADVLLLTNATQVYHLIEVALQPAHGGDIELDVALREGLARTAVCSIGPTCTEALEANFISVDMEPSHPRMGLLVREAAEQAEQILARKRTPATPRHVEPQEPWNDAPFLKACRRERTPYTPVWLMRQAGRYMKEYRDVRARVSMLELCRTPDLVAEVTVTAAERIGADAAILFADILLIVEPLGLNLEFSAGEGPVITPTVRESKDVDKLQEVDPAALQYVYDAVRATRRALDPKTPLIGFCGAPFTLASYMIEGGGSRNYENTKSLMYRDPGAWHALMARISRGLIGYVNGQVDAGAQCIQLFDSWIGALGPDDYREYVLPHVRSLIQGIAPGVPVIHFGTGTATLLQAQAEAGGDVIGLDWRTPLDWGWEQVGPDRGVQGNLDPLLLFAEPELIRARAKRILDQAAGRPGHIFNLGHGILPKTPVDHVIGLIDAVHELSAR